MDIIQELIQYIEPNEQSGALLLTGKWGCGKTHLINRLSNELDKERYGVAIISVFGIDSIDNLTSTIKQRVFYARTNITQETEEKATKARKIIGKAYDVLKEHISVPEAVNTVLSINPFDFMPIEREIGKNRQLILVFDDIERSKLDIQELLGAINEYVEGKKIKTILIADEEKIGKKEYAEFKEKVISRTVRFTPNYAEVIKSIIANYEETAQGYKDFLFRMMGTLVSVFEESKSENLRTFKCLIIDFERVFNHIKELKIQDAALTEILYAFAVTLFKYKGAIGFSQNANPKNEERLSKALQHHYEEAPLGPLKKWIEKGIWQAEEITDHFTKRYCQKEPTDEIKFLYWDFWNLNDSIVKNGLPIVLEKAYRGELCCDDLVSLLVRITIMKKHNITIPISFDYGKIDEGLSLRAQKIMDGEIKEPSFHRFLEKEELEPMETEAKNLYYRAHTIGDDLLIYWSNRSDFINGVRTGDVSKLVELKHRYYISFDSGMMESAYERYASGNNEIKRIVANLIKEIAFRDVIRPDIAETNTSINHLRILKMRIEDLKKRETDSFVDVYHTHFISVLDDQIKQLEAKKRDYM